jgi:hypothetical protein
VSLRRRLERLEAGYSDASPCNACGFDPESPIITVEWEDPPTEEDIAALREWYEQGMPSERMSDSSEEEPSRAPCPRCGREEIIVDWDDARRAELRRLEAEMMARRGWTLDALLPSQEVPQDQVPDYAPSHWSSGGPPNGRRRA